MADTPEPKPLLDVMDDFVALAIARFITKVNALAALDVLVYGGDDWPQPHPVLGMKRLPWEDVPPPEAVRALLDRRSARRLKVEQKGSPDES